MYEINYHTGAGNQMGIKTLAEAEAIADKGAAYTQSNITIEQSTDSGERKVVGIRVWYGTTEGIEDASDPIEFGDYGFYGDWYWYN